MALFETGFTEFDLGPIPTSLDRVWGDLSPWNIAGGVKESYDTRVLQGGRRGAGPQTPYEKFLRWNTPGLSLTDLDVVIRVKPTGSVGVVPEWGVLLRAGGSTIDDASGYLVLIDGLWKISLIRIIPRPAGYVTLGRIVLDTANFQFVANRWYYMRAQMRGTALKGKIWDAAGVEPAAWHVEANDGTHASGWMGVYGDNTWIINYDSITVGTGVDNAPLNPAKPVPPVVQPLPLMIGAQRLTLFEEDDRTPILGTVGETGEILDPSFSTHPLHARPFLRPSMTLGESEIRFRDGTSIIGQANLVVQDQRIDPSDQASGIVTSIVAKAGNTRLLMRRAVWQIQREDSKWYTLLDGIVADLELNDDLVSYQFTMKDIRERERYMRLFRRAFSTSLLPFGVVGGWGTMVRGDGAGGTITEKLIPPVGVQKGTFKADATNPRLGYIQQDVPTTGWGLSGFQIDLLRKAGTPQPVYSIDGSFTELRYTGFGLAWRPENSAEEFRTLWSMPSGNMSIFDTDNAFFIEAPTIYAGGLGPGEGVVLPGVGTIFGLKYLRLNVDAPEERPTNNQRIEYRVLSGMPPSEEVPLFIERPFGDLLAAIYDGEEYGEDGLVVRYDEVAMQKFKDDTGVAVAMITEPPDPADENAFTWIGEHIYRINGYAPAINAEGKVVPVKYALPAADQTLLQLDSTNIAGKPKWKHGPDEAVTFVQFLYPRTFLLPEDPANPLTFVERLADREVYVERYSLTRSLFGERPLEYKPLTVRSFTGSVEGTPLTGDVTQELGHSLGFKRGLEAIDRFSQGAQRVEVPVIVSPIGAALPNTREAQEGDWVIISAIELPDYLTNRRGLNRLMQIVKIKDTSPIQRVFELSDAGPGFQPMPQVTIANVTPNNTRGCVEFDVTVLPTVTDVTFTARSEAEVDYAILAGVNPPPITSNLWQRFLRAPIVGHYSTPMVPTGSKVWLRWRGAKEGRRASAWSVPVAAIMSTSARVGAVTAYVNQFNQVIVSWQKFPTAGGVRLYYAVHNDGTDPPGVLTDFLDYVATASPVTLPFTLAQRQQITVQVVPYPGFAAGAVTGVAGDPSLRVTGQRLTNVPIVPPSDFSVKMIVQATPTGGAPYANATYSPITSPFLKNVEYHIRSKPQGSTDPYGPVQVIQGSNDGSDRLEVKYLQDYEVEMVAVTLDNIKTPSANRPVRTFSSGAPPLAIPLLTQVTAYADRIVYRITFDENTTSASLWYSEYTTDPGSPTSRVNEGTLFTEIRRNDSRFLPGTNICDIEISLGSPNNWHVLSIVGYNALDQVGIEYAPVKTQGAVAARPADITVQPVVVAGSPTATSFQVDVTMPSNITLFDAIVVFRDGQRLAGTIARTAGAGAVQRLTHSGLNPSQSYNFQYKGISNAGIDSANPSPVVTGATVAGTLDAPSITVDSYNVIAKGMYVNITPGTNNPVSVRFILEHSITSAAGPFIAVEGPTSQRTIFHTHISTSGTIQHWTRVKAVAPGWSDSGYSNVVQTAIPPLF